MAPEFFTGRYTEKADVFSLGTFFFAVLKRDFIVIEDKAIYGALVDFHSVGKLGLGFAMAMLILVSALRSRAMLKGSGFYKESLWKPCVTTVQIDQALKTFMIKS